MFTVCWQTLILRTYIARLQFAKNRFLRLARVAAKHNPHRGTIKQNIHEYSVLQFHGQVLFCHGPCQPANRKNSNLQFGINSIDL